VAGRDHRATERLLGRFVNTVPLAVANRSDAGEEPFPVLLGHVRRQVLGAFAHAAVPLEDVTAALAPRASGRPFTQAVVNVKTAPDVPLALPGYDDVTPLVPGWSPLDEDLFLGVGESSRGITGGLKYSFDLFTEPTARALVEDLRTVLASAVAASSAATATAPLLDPVVTVLRPGNGTRRAPLWLIHPPGAGALSYGELSRALPEGLPVLGLERPEGETEAAALPPVRALAEAYAAAVLGHASGGPYRLAGWSAGGVLALEVARVLRERGERVELVGLLDSHRPPPEIHQPAPVDVPLTLFLAEDEPSLTTLGDDWRPLAGAGLRSVPVPGDHHSLLRRPAVEDLGRLLAATLADSEGDGR
jgi:thioesterase domain-containing protein